LAVEFSFPFPLPLGLHARPASIIQENAERFEAEIFWDNFRSGITADAKSALSLVASDTVQNDPCRIRIEGPGELEALQTLKSLILGELPRKEAEWEATQLAPPAKPEIVRVLTQELALFFQGVPAGAGIVRGRAMVYDPALETEEERTEAEYPPAEEKRAFRAAVASLEAELGGRKKKSVDQTEWAVVQAHLAILRDRAFAAKVEEFITADKKGASAAVSQASRLFSGALHASRSRYLRERMADVRDVSRELIARLSGLPAEAREIRLEEPAILVADNVPLSRFLSLDPNKLRGLVVESAGVTSHVLILCRAHEIPAVVGCPNILEKLQSGEEIILDGGRGLIVPTPSPAVSRYFDRDIAAEKHKGLLRREKARLPGMTADGRRVEIAANVGHFEELPAAWSNGAEGIGLFRTELLLADRRTPPDEDEQLEFYVRVAREAGGRPVIIRTFDIGGDKPVSFMPLAAESNPFLGFRGIRIYEKYSGLIRTQLRAILRAAVDGPLKIMFPMVSTVDEVIAARERLQKVGEELAQERVPHRGDIELGMMVEVPSAAMSIDKFSEHVDFFSVGTNDLIQYFFAADRGNPSVRDLNQALHPAFLRLLKAIVDAAHARGKWVGLCGEIAGNPRLLPLLVGFGFDELSMTSVAIPEIKSRLRALQSSECREQAERAADLSSSREVESLLDSFGVGSAQSELITRELVRLHSDCRSKTEALQEFAIMMEAAGRIESRAGFEFALWRREDTFSTGIGFGVAIPHCEALAVRLPSIAFLRFDAPLDWHSSDGQPVDLALMLAIPPAGAASRDHLELLARLSRRLVHEEFRDDLRTARDEQAAVRLITAALAE
jgi:phosphoenolpyruvate-protein phosphotransferase